MKALIDAEVYLYRALAASEVEVEWAPDEWTYVCKHVDAKAFFSGFLAETLEWLPDYKPVLALGSWVSFRRGLYPDYKANRRKYRKPAGFRRLFEWVEEQSPWESRSLEHAEGDDVLGVLYEPGDVIVSTDKDALTLPGFHLGVDGKIFEVTRQEADHRFYAQVLTGDRSDNYPGCTGVGPVTAERLLEGCSSEAEMWQAVIKAYEDAGLHKSFALNQAHLARILRAGEYDFDHQVPVLWNPPSLISDDTARERRAV